MSQTSEDRPEASRAVNNESGRAPKNSPGARPRAITPDSLFDIFTAPRRDSKHWKSDIVSWGEIVDWLEHPADVKECGNYVLGTFGGTTRSKATLVSRGALTLDADKARPELMDSLAILFPYASATHTTYNSTPDALRVRVIIPTDREMSPDEYHHAASVIMDQLGREMFDPGSVEPERYMFKPSAQRPDWYHTWVVDGEPASVDALLARWEPRDRPPEPARSVPGQRAEVAEEYVQGTVRGALRDLDQLADLPIGGTLPLGPKGKEVGWDGGTYAPACSLVRAANSGGMYDLEQAREDFFTHAPTDADFDGARLEHKWAEALKTVGDEPLRPHSSARDDFASGAPSDDRTAGWTPLDLSTFATGTYEPLQATLMPLTDGITALLYRGMTHSAHGESESGKSMILLGEVARLLKLGCRVLYLDYEADPGSIVERLLLMGVTPEQLARLDYVQPEADFDHSQASRSAFEELAAGAYELVVIDGVTEALSQAPAKARSTGGLGGNDDVTIWHDHLPRQLSRRTGAAVVMIDHVAKSPDAGRFAIGGQAKMATITGAAYVVKPKTPLGRGLVGEVELYVAKDRHGFIRAHASGDYGKDRLQLVAIATVDGTDGQLSVRLDPPPRQDGPDARRQRVMERVAAFLGSFPPDSPGATTNTVKREVTGDASEVAAALQALVAEGYVERTVKGQSRLHRLTRLYCPEFEENHND